jgi:hypothetical protein
MAMTRKNSETGPLPTVEPGLVTLPALTVAVVRSSGDPGEAAQHVMKALYGAAYGLKFALKKRGVEMRMQWPRARWNWTPGADPSGGMQGEWALPVPDGTLTADLPQKEEGWPVEVRRWEYGECAWVMHLGAYDAEKPTIARLAEFIDASGLEICGTHEEWYLSQPSAKVPKTVILYQVCPRRA